MKQVTPIVTRRLTLSLLICLVGLSLAQPLVSTAQTNTPEPLQPQAQETVDKGIIAAKVPDYPLAIRYFEEARKLAPDAPVIYLNMGLAESKIPGRELRAMAWFGAYLTAYPDAPNAAAVKEQLNVLEVKNQSNVSGFIKSVQSAASQISDYKKVVGLQRVAVLWTKAGDITAALDTAALCEDNEEGKSFAYYAVSEAQAKGGDIAGAQTTANMIFQQSPDMNRVRAYIIYAQTAIAEAQAKSGDAVGAQRTFDLALIISEEIDAVYRGQAMQELAKGQARSGDIAGAQKTIALMPDDVDKTLTSDFVSKFEKENVQSSESGNLTALTASDWLSSLEDGQEVSFIVPGRAPPLKHPLFLDMAGYLKSLNASVSGVEKMYGDSFKPDEDWKIFDDLMKTAEQLITAQNVIAAMLKQSVGK